MNAQRLGIITSLAVHAGFLFLFLAIPVAGVIPYTKTFYISFAQEEASPSIIQKETKQIIRSKADNVQSISKPEVVEIKQHRDEFIVNEKPVMAAVQGAENPTPAKTEITGIGKAVNQGVSETVFGNSGAPAFTHREMPVYPLLARRLGKEGKVVLKLLIDKNGTLQDIEVIEQSEFGFTEAAVAAVKKSTFSPAHSNGEKVPSKAILCIRFNLK